VLLTSTYRKNVFLNFLYFDLIEHQEMTKQKWFSASEKILFSDSPLKPEYEKHLKSSLIEKKPSDVGPSACVRCKA
jgi:hypothetical protein